jgi:hypothetical protein
MQLNEYHALPEVHECNETLHLCEHICTNTISSYECSCRTGYTLALNRFGCISKKVLFILERTIMCMHAYTYIIDIDECSIGTDNCTHNCQDTQGSYACSCLPGYSLNDDGHTCEGDATCTSYLISHAKLLI